jgi:hypothetical protein
MTTLILIIIGWFACSFITYGFSFAHYQNKWPEVKDVDYKRDMNFCFLISLMGPVSLMGYFLGARSEGFKYGFKIL